MYTTLTLCIEKYPVDSNITGLVSEIHGREWNQKVWNGLIEIKLVEWSGMESNQTLQIKLNGVNMN